MKNVRRVSVKPKTTLHPPKRKRTIVVAGILMIYHRFLQIISYQLLAINFTVMHYMVYVCSRGVE